MTSLKTLVFPVLCIGMIVGLPQGGSAADGRGAAPAGEMVRVFASCVGRLSAEMQHQWLVSDPRADQTEAERAAMIDLLEAAMPEEAGRDVLQERTAARQAHSALLSQALFHSDRRLAEWSRRRAASEIDYCRGLALF
ncbi:hypothetical protein [Tropicimonas aquimaris]|uniref:Lysozyme inhibitor LprI N-terminal domain-containing protein n=1 Tax=Tropicimonas aquimaris TaxID=914152 RepID=A0ABW3IRN2_9RHOB